MNLLALKLLPWKLIGKVAGIAAVVGLLLWYRHSLIESGEVAGRAHVQKQWDAERGRIKAATDAQKTANAIQDAADEARNTEILNDLQEQAASALAERDRTFRLLQRARATGDTVRAAAIAGAEGAIGASEARRDEALRLLAELDAVTADLRVEAELNADARDALVAVVKPQM